MPNNCASLKYWICIVQTVIFSQMSFSQDTIVLDRRSDLEDVIYSTFLNKYQNLDQRSIHKIKQEFKKFDFSDRKYRCQNLFQYIIELDTCGRIHSCNPASSFEDKCLEKFSTNVRKIILSSSLQFPNKVVLPDTSYFLTTLFFAFNSACDPEELEFLEPMEFGEMNKILLYKQDGITFIFHDFENACQ